MWKIGAARRLLTYTSKALATPSLSRDKPRSPVAGAIPECCIESQTRLEAALMQYLLLKEQVDPQEA